MPCRSLRATSTLRRPVPNRATVSPASSASVPFLQNNRPVGVRDLVDQDYSASSTIRALGH
jgi:hypothetical protein